MTTDEIEQAIIDSGGDVTVIRFETIRACTVEVGGVPHVAINADLSEREKKAGLAHELGHIKRGGLYHASTPPLLRQRAETLATRYAAEILAPPQAVREAERQGLVTVWELAEHFGLPEDVMARIVALPAYQNRIL